MSTIEDIPPVPKIEPFEEESFSESSPEPEEQSLTQEPAQVQKRKGGRKPIYATSEERKQRNRQAQAAFRERRTEYIKQLEATIKQHEEALQTLQQSHRSAADECLMLRYKNSLLERILLEKGIDVQGELKSKTESSSVMPHSATSPGSQQPNPIQRAVMNRHGQNRRSTPGSQGSRILRPSSHTSSNHSPRLQPTPSTTMSPSTTRSPIGLPKGGMVLPNGDIKAQQNPHHHQPQQSPLEPRGYPPQVPARLNIPTTRPTMQNMTPSTTDGSRSCDLDNSAGTHNYYPSTFQAHIEQLEQDYDAHADLIDDDNPDDGSAGPGPYPQPFQQQQVPQNQQLPPMGMQRMQSIQSMQPMQPMPPMSSMQPPSTTRPLDPNNSAYAGMNEGFDPYDPVLDADPFGLTASMHFPTQFTFQESSMRR